MKFSSTDARDLCDKYERMLALRHAHERAKTDANFVEPSPKKEMRALANAFPGALRELDVLPIRAIEERIEKLKAAAAEDAEEPQEWMVAVAFFHRLARAALQARAGHNSADDDDLFKDDLDRITNPPNGRLMDLVFERLAKELSVSEDEARARVFGDAVRRRR